MINLLLTNLLSSFLLIPLLLVDQETAEYDITPFNATYPQNATAEAQVIGEGDYIDDLFETDEFLINKPDNQSIEIIKTSQRIVAEFREFPSDGSGYDNGTELNYMCYLAQSGTSLVCTASIFSILLIGINQYFAVIHSLRYHFYISKARCMGFIYTGWIVATIFGILGAVSQNHTSLWHFCDGAPKSSSNYRLFNTIYAIIYFVFMNLAPFIAISAIYVCIYIAARQNSERMRKSRSCNGSLDAYVQVPSRKTPSEEDLQFGRHKRQTSLPKVQSAPNFLNIVETGEVPKAAVTVVKVARTASDRSTNGFINSLKYKISNSSVFRYREEARAAKISIIVIFMVLVCYIPYGITLILNSDLINIRTPRYFNYVALVLLIISNIISPFLFGYRHKRIQREVGKFLGLIPNASSKLSVKKKPVKRHSIVKIKAVDQIKEGQEMNVTSERFLLDNATVVPEVVVTCKTENEKKSILKRVCDSTNWTSYKKCSFITVPDSCLSAEARGSFSSASTQISTEE